MLYIQEYSDFLRLLNFIIVCSFPIIAIKLFNITKNKMLIYLCIISFVEIFVQVYMGNQVSSEILSLSYIIKIIYIIKSLIFISKDNNYLFILVISSLILTKNTYMYIVSLFVNTYILKTYIISGIKEVGTNFYNLKRLVSSNQKKIKEIIKDIDKELNLQKEYKDEAFDLNKKISKYLKESDTPIFLLDINKKYLYSNNAFKSLVENDELDLVNIDIVTYLKYKFLHYEEILQKIGAIGINVYSDLEIKSYDNEVYKFICTTDKIEDRFIIVCILKNITETNAIQNKLIASEEKYKKLMDVLNEGVIISREDKIIYFNDKASQMFNIDSEDIDLKFVTNNFKSKFSRLFYKNTKLVKNKVITKVETKDNRVIEIITTNMILNEENVLLSIVADITHLEKALSDIEESEMTYRLLLQTLPEGIVIIDKSTKKHIYRNEASMKILKTIGIERLNESIRNYIKANQYGVYKTFSINKEKNIDISLAIIEIKEENSLVVVFRTLDNEYKISKIKDELNKIESDNKFKMEFMSNIANDIKKPLESIYIQNNKLINNSNKSDYIKNYNRLVKQNTYRLKRLLNNIEEIQRNEECITLKEFDIVKLVKNIVDISKEYTNKKGLNIKLKSEVESYNVRADIDKLERIILNILSNSIKFTNNGGNIDLSIYTVKNKICISIKDTGIGIPNDKFDIIFENFKQIDTTLSRSNEGTGIGLSVVRKLANIHDIDISIKSNIDNGSEFSILLPDYQDIDNKVSNKEEVIFADREKIEIEFSDIYLDISS